MLNNLMTSMLNSMSYLSIWSKAKDAIKNSLINAWRFINGQLDAIAYKLLSSIYGFFRELSELYLYNERIMQTLGKRVGLILGIFILFKLAVAIISYIINPDKVSDSSKGAKKLVINIVFSLFLLATVNIIFKEAYLVQKKIVSSQAIEKIFFGKKADTERINLSFYLYSAFLDVNLPECDGEDVYGDITQLSSECNSAIVGNRYVSKYVIQERNLRPILATYDIINEPNSDGDYLFDYTPIISIVCAVMAILILLSSCMDVATRIIKLLFLQIIAPIPIVSNMVPGKGADTFKKWYKECFNTYLSLFIRIAVISFAVFMITLIKTEFSDIFVGRNFFIQVLLIIGCLMFAKQTPKLIENLFGIKMDGMSLRPLKKFQEQALFGKNISGIGAAGLAGAAAFGANTLANKGNIFSGLAGAGSAFARGTVGAIKGQNMGQVYKGAYSGAIKARNNRDSRQKLGVSAPSVWLNSFERKLGIDTKAEVQDAKIKMYDEFTSSADAIISLSESEVQKYANQIELNKGAITSTIASTYGIKTLGELREAMNDTVHYTAKQRAELNQEYENIKGDTEKLYRKYATSGSIGLNSSTEFSFIKADDVNGETAKAHIKNLSDIYDKNKDDEAFKGFNYVSGENVKDINKKVKYTSTSTKNSGKYRQAHKVQEQTNREKK